MNKPYQPVLESINEIKDAEGLEKFFNSSFPPYPRHSIHHMDVLKTIVNETVRVRPLKENGSTIKLSPEEEHSLKFLTLNGGGDWHSLLKRNAFLWLLQQGEKNALLEHTVYSGSRPDLIGEDLKYWIECGDTSPDKLVEAFRTGYKAFILFPFTNPVYIEGYMFTYHGEGKPFKRDVFKNNPTRRIWD